MNWLPEGYESLIASMAWNELKGTVVHSLSHKTALRDVPQTVRLRAYAEIYEAIVHKDW